MAHRCGTRPFRRLALLEDIWRLSEELKLGRRVSSSSWSKALIDLIYFGDPAFAFGRLLFLKSQYCRIRIAYFWWIELAGKTLRMIRRILAASGWALASQLGT
jgi:hypothetical protein